MTPGPRIFERFAPALSFALLALAAGIAAPSSAGAATRTPRATVAYVPSAIWGDYLGPATGELALRPHAIYWFEGEADSSMGRVLGDLERYQADDAKAAPRDPIVAFVGRYAAYPSNTLQPGVAVMDTAGALIADFPGAQGYAWSPDGTRLAVLYPRDSPPPLQRIRALERMRRAARRKQGVSVWDRRDGSVRSFTRWPSRAAWAGNDSLLLQFPDSVLVIDPRTGKTRRTSHNGTIVSPDFRYAMWPGEGGENTRVFDEARGERITDALFAPFHQEDKTQIRSAFWVQGRGADHQMVICGCDGIQYPEPSCRTRVIDVETGNVLASFRGEALGPTADGRGVVVFRRDRGRLIYHDLRPVVREQAGRAGVRLEPEQPEARPKEDRPKEYQIKEPPFRDGDRGEPPGDYH